MSELKTGFLDYLNPITAGLSAVGNIASTIITNKQNIKAQERMFDKTNAYNTPANQVIRMKAAGLNPALMYQGTPQNTAQQSKMPERVAPQIDPTLMADILLKKAQTNQAQNNADLMPQRVADLTAKVLLQDEQIKTLQAGRPNIALQGENIQADTANKLQTNVNLEQAQQIGAQQLKTMEQQYAQNSKMNPISVESAKINNQKQMAEMAKTRQETALYPKIVQMQLARQVNDAALQAKQGKQINLANEINTFTNELTKKGVNVNGNMIETLVKQYYFARTKLISTFK